MKGLWIRQVQLLSSCSVIIFGIAQEILNVVNVAVHGRCNSSVEAVDVF